MAILMLRARKEAVMHRVAYCLDCHHAITYQSVPYGKEWSMLQKLAWAHDCDEHRSLCDKWIGMHAEPAPPGAAPDNVPRPTAPANGGREVGA